jgi:hypothetical protein
MPAGTRLPVCRHGEILVTLDAIFFENIDIMYFVSFSRDTVLYIFEHACKETDHSNPEGRLPINH